MRIFIALSILEKLQNEVLKYREFYPDLPVRWLENKNLHITLIPPWEEKEEDIEKIKSVLKSLENKIGPIAVEFKRVSYGPNSYFPRLIWATGKAPEAIVEFKKALEQGLGRQAEKNEFLLHLTLARFKPEDFQSFPIKKIDDEINWKETFNEFVIMHSRLSPDGADYEILERFRL